MSRASYYKSLDYMARVADVFERLNPPRSEMEIEDLEYRGSRIVSAAALNRRYEEMSYILNQKVAAISPTTAKDARPVIGVADSAVTLPASATTFTTVASLFVDQGMAAVVEYFWNEAETDAALADIQFRIRVGQVPAPDLQNIRGRRGTRSSPFKIRIMVQERTPVILEAQSLSAVPHYARGGIVGYEFTPPVSPLEMGRAWTSG